MCQSVPTSPELLVWTRARRVVLEKKRKLDWNGLIGDYRGSFACFGLEGLLVCTEQLYTNQPVPLRQTENGAESCMFKSWQATLFTKISLKTVWTFWAARKKGCTKNILFNEWIVGWCQTLIDLDFFVLSKGSLSVARAFRGLKEATHNKHIEANLLACPFSWKKYLAFSFFFF